MEKEPQTTLSVTSNRTWGYQELAMCYFPHIKPESATNQLSRWIRFCPELQSRLVEQGWKPGQKILTPRQADCIVEHLGEP